jgi:carbon storage regulator
MLILSRKVGERITIAGNIEIAVQAILGNRVQIAIQAPQNIRIVRRELEYRSRPNETKPTP